MKRILVYIIIAIALGLSLTILPLTIFSEHVTQNYYHASNLRWERLEGSGRLQIGEVSDFFLQIGILVAGLTAASFIYIIFRRKLG